MEGEYFGKQQDVIAPFSREGHSMWLRSLQRVARAQAILWNRTSLTERQAILKELEEKEQK